MKGHLSIILILTVSSLSNYVFAQSIAINNDGSAPDAKAILDIKSTTQGILIPRMTTAQRTSIASPTAGLLIYDTDLKMMMMQNGTSGSPSWETSATTVSIWNLLGNASTIAGTNFLGTTDAVDLVFKTNNTETMRITSSGDVGIGGTPSSTRFLITKAYSNTSGSPINNYFNQKNSLTLSGTSAFTNSGGSRIDVVSSNTNTGNVIKGEMINILTSGSAAADSIIGFDIYLQNTSTGTIGKEYGIKVSDINPQNGIINNTYGLFIGDLSRGTQTNAPYGMYSSDANARSYHAGNTGFGETNPSANLHVKGTMRFQDGTNDDDGKILQMVSGQIQSVNPSALELNVRKQNSNYTIDPEDDVIYLTGAAGAADFNLPRANTVPGKIYIVSNYAGFPLTLKLDPSDTEIIGLYSSGTSISIANNETFRVASIGNDRYAILSSNR